MRTATDDRYRGRGDVKRDYDRPVEARLVDVGSGLAPADEGWFVVGAREAAWLRNDMFGWHCVFEANSPVVRGRPGLEPTTFPQLGITLAVLEPGSRAASTTPNRSRKTFSCSPASACC